MSTTLPDSPTRRRPAARPGRLALCAAVLALVLYAAAVGALWAGQERLLFHPDVLSADAALATAPDVHETRFDVPGAQLSALELRLPDPDGVVFFLHGNAGSLQSWFVNADFYRRANYDLVMFDYRGFGKSSGRIESEAQLHADVEAVWQAVAPRYRGRHVVFYGRSLGTGLAAALAAAHPPDQTILVSPYFSMARLAAERYPWVPGAVLRYPLRTDLALPRVATPVLLVHGDRDELIPPAHSRALLALAPRARLALIAGAGHGDMQQFGSYLDAVRAALPGR